MRIAIPLAQDGQLAEEFSRAETFAIYDVHDHTRAVAYVGRQSFAEPGCGRTPGFLRGHEVEVVLGHCVSQKAENHLLEVGIVSIKDAPLLTADALIAHLVSGTLQATPPDAAMHESGCQSASGGCGHCCGHSADAQSQPASAGDETNALACEHGPGECHH